MFMLDDLQERARNQRKLDVLVSSHVLAASPLHSQFTQPGVELFPYEFHSQTH